MIDEFYLREGEAADEARKLLDDAGIDYTSHVEFGNPAVAINAYAREHGCQRIVMGSRGNGALPASWSARSPTRCCSWPTRRSR